MGKREGAILSYQRRSKIKGMLVEATATSAIVMATYGPCGSPCFRNLWMIIAVAGILLRPSS